MIGIDLHIAVVPGAGLFIAVHQFRKRLQQLVEFFGIFYIFRFQCKRARRRKILDRLLHLRGDAAEEIMHRVVDIPRARDVLARLCNAPCARVPGNQAVVLIGKLVVRPLREVRAELADVFVVDAAEFHLDAQAVLFAQRSGIRNALFGGIGVERIVGLHDGVVKAEGLPGAEPGGLVEGDPVNLIRAVLQAVDVIRYTLHRFQNQRVHVVVHHFIVPIEAVQTQVLVTLGLEFPNHGVQIPPGGLHAVRQSLLRRIGIRDREIQRMGAAGQRAEGILAQNGRIKRNLHAHFVIRVACGLFHQGHSLVQRVQVISRACTLAVVEQKIKIGLPVLRGGTHLCRIGVGGHRTAHIDEVMVIRIVIRRIQIWCIAVGQEGNGFKKLIRNIALLVHIAHHGKKLLHGFLAGLQRTARGREPVSGIGQRLVLDAACLVCPGIFVHNFIIRARSIRQRFGGVRRRRCAPYLQLVGKGPGACQLKRDLYITRIVVQAVQRKIVALAIHLFAVFHHGIIMVQVLVLHGVEAGNTAHAVERYAVLRQEVGDHRRRRNPPSQALLHVEGKRFNMAQLPQIQRDGAVDLPVCLIVMGAHAAAIPIAVQYLAAAVIAVCQAVEDALLFFADRCILGGRVKVRTGAFHFQCEGIIALSLRQVYSICRRCGAGCIRRTGRR